MSSAFRCGLAALVGIAVLGTVVPVIGQDSSPAIDGWGNNRAHPLYGAAGTRLLRLVDAEYADRVAEPTGGSRPNARAISNAMAAQRVERRSNAGLSDMFWLWGQFLDHDLDLTTPADPPEEMHVAVPAGDSWFDPRGTGSQLIRLHRSLWDLTSGRSGSNPRQQINVITSFIDASNVYGSDEQRARALRANNGTGELRTSRGDMLPFNEEGLDNAGGTLSAMYLAGDIRANENVALTAMHTLWVREHNRQARALRRAQPGLGGEAVYQRARARVAALIQRITYEEFLPRLLGEGALGRYRGYDPRIDAGISNEFSTAAYRLGHSMVGDELLRLRSNGRAIGSGNLPLQDAFFAPWEIDRRMGIEPYLRGIAVQRCNEVDLMIVDSLRNFLFGPPGAGGFDLASLNIQRGRDHGLADYNTTRAELGLGRLVSFAQISRDRRTTADLQQLYRDIDDIDLWVGGLAEDHVRGAVVGPTFHAILVDQFRRLRDGDRFFYRNRFAGDELRGLEGTRLADVIRRNSEIGDELADDVFRAGR